MSLYLSLTMNLTHFLPPSFHLIKVTDVYGRSIVIMVWQKCIGFEHNQGMGGAELYFKSLKISQPTGGWYPLFPMHSLGSDSNDSP